MFQNRLSPIYRYIQKTFLIQTTGLENIARDQNYIFAMNHQSIMDIPITYSILAPQTNRKINLFLSHIFYNIFFPLTKPLEAISINMNKGKSTKIRHYNLKQLKIGIEKLTQGNNVLIYPEGGMDGAKNSKIARGETGAIRLALSTGIPVIPIGVRGSNHAYPFTISSLNPFAHQSEIPIQITVGKAICYKKYSYLDLNRYSEVNKLTLRRLTEDLMKLLAKLSGLPRLHGEPA